MRSPVARLLLVPLLLVCFTAGCSTEETAGPEQIEGPEKLVIGHPACMSGKYAKAGEQAIGGIEACVAWVNDVHGGVSIGDRKVPLEYKYYDSESKKEGVTSLIERLITVDKVNVVFSSYSSGLTLAGAPVAERYGTVFMDHGGASDRIFQQGFQYTVQTIGPWPFRNGGCPPSPGLRRASSGCWDRMCRAALPRFEIRCPENRRSKSTLSAECFE
jgi:hypothetical protein